jgi:hypothetical protein
VPAERVGTVAAGTRSANAGPPAASRQKEKPGGCLSDSEAGQSPPSTLSPLVAKPGSLSAYSIADPIVPLKRG